MSWINWSESDVPCGQVWWPILGICALHLTHPKCTHSAVNTHTVNTHPEQWAAIYTAAPGEQLGVRCLAQGHLSRGFEGGESIVHSLPPPTIPAGQRLELATFGLRVRFFNNKRVILSIYSTFFLHFKFAHVRPLTNSSVLYIVFLPFCTLPMCIFVYCSFVVCVLLLSFCCTVELLSLLQIPRKWKHTWQ